METLREIYQCSRNLGLVANMREFSQMCGKGETWCSSTLAKGRHATLDALVRLYINLLPKRDHRLGDNVSVLADHLWLLIQQQVNDLRSR